MHRWRETPFYTSVLNTGYRRRCVHDTANRPTTSDLSAEHDMSQKHHFPGGITKWAPSPLRWGGGWCPSPPKKQQVKGTAAISRTNVTLAHGGTDRQREREISKWHRLSHSCCPTAAKTWPPRSTEVCHQRNWTQYCLVVSEFLNGTSTSLGYTVTLTLDVWEEKYEINIRTKINNII